MSFMIKNKELLGKCTEIWEKVSNSMKKGFDDEPVYNEKYTKTKTKSYERKINTNFNGDKEPKEGFQYVCVLEWVISVILKCF